MKQKQEQQPIRRKTTPTPTSEKTKTPLTLSAIQSKLDSETLLQMQRALGNQAVHKYLVQRRAGEDGFTVEDELSSQIQSQIGQGSTVGATPVAQNVSTLTGVDVTDTKMQWDSELPTQVGAKAMAVGDTVFVGSGHDSTETVGHELAHIAQNKTGNAPTLQASGLTVTAANSPYEDYADSVGSLAAQSSSQVERAAQEETFALQRSHEEEESALQRQASLEEEQEFALQREPALEEEENLQREMPLEEEDLALDQQQPSAREDDELALAPLQEGVEEEEMTA